MTTANFEKYAADLGQKAVLQKTVFVKQALGLEDVKKFVNTPAGRYTVGGLGGAGLGALVGAMQPRKKGRNALYYGAIGGLGGLGLGALANQYYGQKQLPPPTKTEYEAMLENPNTSFGTAAYESLTNPLDALHHSFTKDMPALYDEAKRKLPGKFRDAASYVGNKAHDAYEYGSDAVGAYKDWTHRTGTSIGENYLYPALHYWGWV